MDTIIIALILLSIIGMGVCGMRMGRYETLLFEKLENLSPELWEKLGKPSSSSIFKPSRLIKADKILNEGSDDLKSNKDFSELYSLAQKWRIRFKFSNYILVVVFLLITFKNGL